MQTCKGRTRNDTACRAPAGAGGLCFFHANPDSAKQLGKVGGQKNRKLAVDLEVPDNLTATGLCKMNIEVMRLLLSGELRAREACAFVQLSNSLSRIIPTADLEARLAALEEQIAQSRQTSRKEDNQPPDTDLADPIADGTELVEAEQPAGPVDTAQEEDATQSIVEESDEGEELI